MIVRYLIYSSHLVDPSGAAAVPPIIRAARANNAIRGITGALIFDGERFCQYIEGASDEIERTYAAIGQDLRHDAMRVLASGYLHQRRFAQWSMGYVYTATPAVIDSICQQSVPSVVDKFASVLALSDSDL